jgi:hypothetical protein
MTMKRWLTLIAAWLMVVPAFGQEAEVDRAEVLRLGDLVQHVDGIGNDPEALFVEAMGPPATDADKWFISVLTMQGCAPCAKLKADWETSPWLLALADPNNPKLSWAHYNVYAREDRSQAFRFEKLNIEAYPTILVQPPRSKRYGDPSTVVFQGTYGGDPEKLARQITAAIRQYVAKLEGSQPPQPPAQRAAAGTGGIDPPWQPPPKVDPPLPNVLPVFPDRRPLIPPNLDPPDLLMPTVFRWGTAGTVTATAVLTLLLTWGLPRALLAIRQWRIENRQRPLLTDEQFQQLLQALRTGGTVAPSDQSRSPSGT